MADRRIYQLDTATSYAGKYLAIDVSTNADAEKYPVEGLIPIIEQYWQLNNNVLSPADQGNWLAILASDALSVVDFNGSFGLPTRTITSSTTLGSDDFMCLVDATSEIVNCKVPDATTCEGRMYAIICINKTYTARLRSEGGTINGKAAGVGITFADEYEGYIVQSDGTNWYILAQIAGDHILAFKTITKVEGDEEYPLTPTWGATSIAADSYKDVLFIHQGEGIEVDMDATNDAVKISAGATLYAFKYITNASDFEFTAGSDVVTADKVADTLTFLSEDLIIEMDALHDALFFSISSDFLPHNLLASDVHLDAVTANVVKGDLVYGNATPKWDRLPVGADNTVLTVSDGIPTWVQASDCLCEASDTILSLGVEDIAFEFRDLTVASDIVYILDIKASFDYTILSAVLQADDDINNVAIYIGSDVVGGLDAIDVTDAISDTDATSDNDVDIGDQVTLEIPYNPTATLIRGKIRLQR